MDGESENRLYDRDAEIAHVAGLVRAVGAGSGRMLFVEGPAGIGKSRMLGVAAAGARAAGFRVLEARSGEDERDFAFGVVRQLFEPLLAAADPVLRARLLTGAATLAAPVLEPGRARPAMAPAGNRAPAVRHGLYWLTANLAVEAPLLIAVDDVQWIDDASSAWLGYLSRRLDGLPVLVACAMRTGEPGAGAFRRDPADDPMVLTPLTDAGTARLVGDAFGADVDPELGAACHAAARGNPFYVRELARTLAGAGMRPDRAAAARVADVTPASVSRSVVERLARLPEAAALARAVAVLGTRAELRHAAALADLDAGAAAGLVDALEGAAILTARPLGFVHPIVRAAVYDTIPAATRARQHAHAAALIGAEGADAVHVASHLMAAEPLGDATVVERLRVAARAALEEGAPAEAAAYLRRARAEPPPAELRGAVLRELGGAELLARDPAAEDHLRDALPYARDPVTRARTALLLAEAVGFAGRLADAREISSFAIAELDGTDPGLTVALEAQRGRNDAIDRRYAAGFEQRMPLLRDLAASAGAAGRELQLCIAFRHALRGSRQAEVVELVERGLDGGRFIEEEGADTPGAVTAVAALVYADELERVRSVLADMERDAGARGAILALVASTSFGAYAEQRRGGLRVAEAEHRAALELTQEHEQHFPGAFVRSYLAQTLVARGELAEAERLTEGPMPGQLDGTTAHLTFLEARARLALAQGRSRDAIADLRESGEICCALGIANPGAFPWRSLLAMALGPGAADEAQALVASELAEARRLGQARGIGTALYAQGLLHGGDERIALLREAAHALEPSPARLEHAAALVELGVALRLTRRMVEAREPLHRALDLADRCGAHPLSARARAELRIAGARPRRTRLTGAESLTANERRVALMATNGLSNPEIAQALFVTRKTVEKHLSAVYRKLAVDGRAELAGALETALD